MKLLALLALSTVGVVTTHAIPARADDALAQCIASSDKAIDLRKHGKLVEARKVLATCAVVTCGADIQATCEKYLDEVNADLPTIVFVPKSGAGGDLASVKVSVDGAVLMESLDGRPFTLDPGRHVFKFDVAGQAPVEKEFVLTEREKDRRETIVIGPVPVAQPPTPVRAPRAVAEPVPPRSGASALKAAGFVTGGAGIVGIGIGAVLGGLALSDTNSATCNTTTSVCGNPSKETAAQRLATGSTIGFIAGGALLAGGVVMVVMAPKEGATQTRHIEVTPMVGNGRGGMWLRGGW